MTNRIRFRMLDVSAPDLYVLWPTHDPFGDPDSNVHLIDPNEHDRLMAYHNRIADPVNLHQYTALCGKGLDIDTDRIQSLEEYAQAVVPKRLAEFNRVLGDDASDKVDLMSTLMGDQRTLCDKCSQRAGRVMFDHEWVTLATIEIEYP